MPCSHSHILMTKNLAHLVKRDKKKGMDTNHLWALPGHTFLAYNMIVDGTDYEIDKKEEDFIS